MSVVRTFLALVFLGTIAGCGEGYPSGDERRLLTAAERLQLVRTRLEGNETEVHSIALLTPCTLRVKWKDQQETRFDLLQLETVVDTTPSGDFVVFLKRTGSNEHSPLFFSTPDWALMTMVRSDLNQLRGHCAGVYEQPD